MPGINEGDAELRKGEVSYERAGKSEEAEQKKKNDPVADDELDLPDAGQDQDYLAGGLDAELLGVLRAKLAVEKERLETAEAALHDRSERHFNSASGTKASHGVPKGDRRLSVLLVEGWGEHEAGGMGRPIVPLSGGRFEIGLQRAKTGPSRGFLKRGAIGAGRSGGGGVYLLCDRRERTRGRGAGPQVVTLSPCLALGLLRQRAEGERVAERADPASERPSEAHLMIA